MLPDRAGIRRASWSSIRAKGVRCNVPAQRLPLIRCPNPPRPARGEHLIGAAVNRARCPAKGTDRLPDRHDGAKHGNRKGEIELTRLGRYARSRRRITTSGPTEEGQGSLEAACPCRVARTDDCGQAMRLSARRSRRAVRRGPRCLARRRDVEIIHPRAGCCCPPSTRDPPRSNATSPINAWISSARQRSLTLAQAAAQTS